LFLIFSSYFFCSFVRFEREEERKTGEIGGSDGARDFIGAVGFPAEEARSAARFHDFVLRRSASTGGGRGGASAATAAAAAAATAACCSDIEAIDPNLSVSNFFFWFPICIHFFPL